MFKGIIDDNCTDDELDNIVCKHGLLQHNIDAVGELFFKPGIKINLVSRDENGNVTGGIMCNTFLMAMFIDILWVNASYRGQGIGYRLITEAERIAKEAGCIFAHTNTASYQSPDFYKRQGYEVYAILDGYPNDICMYSLKKNL